MALLVSPLSAAFAQSSLGQFEGHGDIGPVKVPGSASYDPEHERYTVSAAGTNMWDKQDELFFAWKRMKGDFQISARVKFVGEGKVAHRKIGVIARKSLDADSPYVDVAVHGDGLTSLQVRHAAGEVTTQIMAPIAGANIVQLERKGNKYTMRVAWDGEPLSAPRDVELDLGDEVYVGLFVCSHDAEEAVTAEFDNVRISVPAADDFVPYRDFIGSNLEIMDVATGVRTIVYRADDSIQAPNWTTDGKALIFNRNGRLYRFDLATREPTEIDTDFAIENNNDHVLSFDGKMLAISHRRDAESNSIVYTVPVGGGKPKEITPTGPSYLHGWSPDGKELVFTGGRDGNFDIYSIASDGSGAEKRLTTSDALDDGPEYSPNGSHIYFNSTRSGQMQSGLMQIWRMPPGGYEHEQVTDDEFNNWFPHISPDGKQIVIISYGQDVKPEDHPFYKQCYLRLMPYPAGKPKVIAYVYGGQGTINVPSWSPDSKRIAFVSNTAGN
jgi:regulation of enolase protein 1 (concanavalin A-like superfamily)